MTSPAGLPSGDSPKLKCRPVDQHCSMKSLFNTHQRNAEMLISPRNEKPISVIPPPLHFTVNWFGLAVRRRPAGKRKDLGSIPASALLSHQKGCGFWTLSCDLCPSLPTEILKWLSSLPILMHKSFWWYSDRYMISLSPHLHTPAFPPFSPSLISCKVSFLRTLSTMFTLHIQKLCRPVKHYGVTRKAYLITTLPSFSETVPTSKALRSEKPI